MRVYIYIYMFLIGHSLFICRRSWLRGLTPNDMVWPMVLGLIMANVIVFMLWRVADGEFMLNNFSVSYYLQIYDNHVFYI